MSYDYVLLCLFCLVSAYGLFITGGDLFFLLIIHAFPLKVTLEAEVTNKGALALYGRLGFIRSKRLFRYYLNGVDAFRLKLLFPRPEPCSSQSMIPTNAQIQRHNSEKQNVEDSLEHCL